MSKPVEFVRQARRVRTEAALIDAFETVLIRDGAGNVTVQAIAKEAGVAKTLIYKYFDGIEGLIKTWAGEREIFLPLNELFPEPEEAAKMLHDDPYEFAKMQILKQAEHMRNHPVYIELCLAELSGSGPVVDALLALRQQRNEAESNALGENLDGSAMPMLMPMMLMPAAVTYLAMRARKSPLYAGMVQLDTDEGWDSMMAAVKQVLDLIGLSAQMAELATADQQQLARNLQDNISRIKQQDKDATSDKESA